MTASSYRDIIGRLKRELTRNIMNTEDFNFHLPEELIAQTPLEKRDSSKLLVIDKDNHAA